MVQDAISAMQQAFEQNRITQRQAAMIQKVNQVSCDGVADKTPQIEALRLVEVESQLDDVQGMTIRQPQEEVVPNIPAKSWSSLVAENKLTSKVMCLEFFHA